MSPIPGQASAAVGGRSFDLSARVTRSNGGGGVLWATGTENSGISLFVQDGRLVLDYNAFDDHTVLESDIEIPEDDSELVARFRRGDAMAGSIELVIDGRSAASAEVPLFMRMISSVGSSIGYDHGSAVSPRYAAPFPFEGTLHEVVIQLISAPLPGTDESAARAGMSQQ